MNKRKIAILGGGIGSLTAAYYLTRTPELRAKHDVTLYQMGWRLGGKCASGRSLVPNQSKRIEEHGLHLWFGFYQNAFHTIQEVYDRKPTNADDELVTWRDGFRPCSYTPIGEDYQGKLDYWPFEWPKRGGVPGEASEPNAVGVIFELLGMIKYAAEALRDLTTQTPGLLGRVGEMLRAGEATAIGSLLEMLDDMVDGSPLEKLLPKMPGLAQLARDVRTDLEADADGHLDDPTFRRLFSVLDLGSTVIFGMVDPKYGIMSDFEIDLDVIDHYEFRDWLLENGGNEWVVKKSSYLRALYDLPFAYEDGDIDKPGLAAGTAVRILLRIIFTYEEAAFFEMRAGMGEVVIAPMYEVLKQQGVKFELFKKVTRLELSPDKRWIQRVHFDRQVDIVGGAAYQPTFREGGITCWPSEPLYDQIVDGANIKAKLDAKKSSLESNWCDVPPAGTESIELGVDFDQVVLGIALAAFKPLNGTDTSMCAELFPESDRFAAMVKGTAIVPTQSFQIWTKDDIAGLGWQNPREDPPAMDGAPEPYSVWADCSHVLQHEPWPAPKPKGVFYFCGPWKNDLTTQPKSDVAVPQKAHDQVEANAIDWLKKYVGYMWPLAADPANPTGLDWKTLHDPTNAIGDARMDFQWIRPNVDPTECVEASLKGTTQLRLKADESGFENLYLAGAWLRTGINATCVEAAVMSGMDCARAVSGEPLKIVGEWFCMKKPARFR